MPKRRHSKQTSHPAANALRALRRRLPGRIAVDSSSRLAASVDNLRLSFLPSAVIQVEEASEVGVVLEVAHRYEVPVTTRGAGSSATGSAVPVRGGWVLDLSALQGIQIDPLARMATVGAGVVTADLQATVEKQGLFYPPDPSSKKYSTIGGNIACNAGGMRCVKYGVTRDYVVALDGFFANGEPAKLGLPLKKYVSGFNLRDLWIGSEGTLGVITSATLRLVSLPYKRWAGMFAFRTERAALRAVAGLLQAGVQPSILEFLDRQSVACAEKFSGGAVFPGHSRSSLLLIELDGTSSEVRTQRTALFDHMEGKAIGFKEARTPMQAEKLWQVRRTCSQSMYLLADTKLNEDVVVPLDRQAELIAYTLELKKQIGLPTPTYGHAGDGNLHVHIMYNRGNAEEAKRAREGILLLMKKVVALGGVITGEHGIGLAKAPFMELQHSAAEISVMRSVKEALDPKGILNPGKIFEPFEVWDHQPMDVRLPWDHR